jgi:hypothetical protein
MARKQTHIDVEIDKLTNSIENILTGEVFDTQIVQLAVKVSASPNFGQLKLEFKSKKL